MLGSWALFVLGFGVSSISVAGEWINVKDARKLRRYVVIEKLLGARLAGRSDLLRQARMRSDFSRNLARSRMAAASLTIGRTTAERRAAAARGSRNEAAGIPSDEYYIETARTNGLNVVRLDPGQSIDADTGGTARRTGGGVWDWVGESGGSRRVLTVRNNTVVELSDGAELELPAGTIIRAGETIVIPPIGTPQRAFAPPPAKTAVRPPDAPAAKDQVVAIPVAIAKIRVTKLREKGESIFGAR